VSTLKNPLIHHCYPTLEEYSEHMNRYSTAAAQMLVDRGHAPRTFASLLWHTLINPLATFFYNFFFRLGFLDGREGLLQHLNHSVYIHWKFVKAWYAVKDK
jgi:hypothetical protein